MVDVFAVLVLAGVIGAAIIRKVQRPARFEGSHLGRGRPDPRADRRDRHDAPALARVADRARPERVAGELVARLGRALGPVRRRRGHGGPRARLRLGARADHPQLPRLPPALEAPPHRDGGVQRLLRAHARARAGSSRSASTCPRRRCASAPARCPDLTWKQTLDTFSCTECGRCQDVCPAWTTGQGAVAEAADHGAARPGLRGGARGSSAARTASSPRRSCRTR